MMHGHTILKDDYHLLNSQQSAIQMQSVLLEIHIAHVL
jgi:hypothetical protein